MIILYTIYFIIDCKGVKKMFNVEMVSDNLADFNDCEDVEIHFSKSIEFNPKLDLEIRKVYRRTLNNRAKFILGCFHLNVFENLESIVRNTNESDDFILDLSEFISDYFDDADSKLNIKNLKDFDEFLVDLKLSSIILNSALEENDMELIYESFYQLKSRLQKDSLINNFRLSTVYDIIDVDSEYVKTFDNYELQVENNWGGK